LEFLKLRFFKPEVPISDVNETAASPILEAKLRHHPLRPMPSHHPQDKVKTNNIKQDQDKARAKIQTIIIVTHYCIFSYVVATHVVIIKNMIIDEIMTHYFRLQDNIRQNNISM